MERKMHAPKYHYKQTSFRRVTYVLLVIMLDGFKDSYCHRPLYSASGGLKRLAGFITSELRDLNVVRGSLTALKARTHQQCSAGNKKYKIK